MKTLIITEKASVKKAMEKVVKAKFLCVAGHIMNLEYDKLKQAPWLKTKLETLLEDNLCYSTLPRAKPYLDQIKRAAKEPIDELILACDPDQQGDLIGSHILNFFNLEKIRVYKIKLESLTPNGIKLALEKKELIEGNQGYSGQLRGRLDLWFGSILSRLVSLFTFKKTNRWNTFNTGRVQTPTLYFVKKRTQEQNKFKPTEYYTLKIEESKLFPAYEFTKKYESKVELENLTELKLDLLEIKDELVEPKVGLNTDQLLGLLAREHAVFKKLGSPVTKLLSSMYLKGFLTYPRTENNKFNNYPDLLEETRALYEKNFKIKGFSPVLNPSKIVTDHSPICPLVLISEAEDPLQQRVLTSIYNHLKKIYSGPNLYKRYYFKTMINGVKSEFSLLKIVKRVYDDGLNAYELPDLQINDSILVPISLCAKTTTKPASYTPASLLSEMKKNHVGTKSTRAIVIEDLLNHKYLVYNKHSLELTEKGSYLCDYWNLYWPMILSPDLTKSIEQKFPILNKNDLFNLETAYKLELKQLVKTTDYSLK